MAAGGRTGRDGIHGATFSSAELTSQSETVSGGAVQIGNAITEKMLLDVLLAARDRGLYNAVTDCGAGGLSSAVGEMGETIGAEVWLERVPLKYEGLSYTEIWISEAQERMVFSVPPEKLDELSALCASEGVEATVIGRFVPTGRLVLKYNDHQVADLAMTFLHNGRPAVVREAVYNAPSTAGAASWPLAAKTSPRPLGEGPGVRASSHHAPLSAAAKHTETLLKILGSLNVCSKEWIIRQYDHEVQGGSVVKPLVGAANDGPSDAAVLRPVLSSRRGLVVACGMNPCYGDWDPYAMAASAIDEAVRNCVAVGADPQRIALLDNFCWGNTDRPETLGSLVRAALACYDLATALGTPFISGKDSLKNEFRPTHASQPISIPPSLLISALGQVDDVGRSVTMDLKEPGNRLYLVGLTRRELGGSHFALVEGLAGGAVPKVDPQLAKKTFAAVHHAISNGLVRACHDLSEGGLAVAAAEMAFAGGLGARLSLENLPCAGGIASSQRPAVGGQRDVPAVGWVERSEPHQPRYRVPGTRYSGPSDAVTNPGNVEPGCRRRARRGRSPAGAGVPAVQRVQYAVPVRGPPGAGRCLRGRAGRRALCTRRRCNRLLRTGHSRGRFRPHPEQLGNPKRGLAAPAAMVMNKPRVLILRAPGTNCDQETAFAFERAGGLPAPLHVNRLLEQPRVLEQFQILCIPGGFSFGDDVAAGRILAVQMRHHLAAPLAEFKAAGKLILGICNGFQVMIKSGILLDDELLLGPPATLTYNDSGKYEDRWVRLGVFGAKPSATSGQPPTAACGFASPSCVFLDGIDEMYLPVAHGEGKFIPRDPAALERLDSAGQLVLRYLPLEVRRTPGATAAASSPRPLGEGPGVRAKVSPLLPGEGPGVRAAPLPFPDNPNGSVADVAGVCDATGRVLGLMPHPERHIDPTQHPRWTRGEGRPEGDGLAVFRNAVKFFA